MIEEISEYKKKQLTYCKKCRKNCYIDDKDFYMVTDKLWKTFGVGRGVLCLDCFKKKLGRKFKPNEMKQINVNKK